MGGAAASAVMEARTRLMSFELFEGSSFEWKGTLPYDDFQG